VSDGRDLVSRICGFTAGVVGFIALVGGLLGGAGEALGALVGGMVTIANFGVLHWMAARAVRETPPTSGRAQRVWLLTSSLRYGVLALILGMALTSGLVGVVGFFASLAALPVALVVEGLRSAGTS